MSDRPAASDHFDGRRFFNPNGAPAGKGIIPLLRWQLGGGRTPWPQSVANRSYPPPPRQVSPGEVAVTFVGHATFLLRFAGGVVLTDPVFSERASPFTWAGPRRVRPPGLVIDQLPPLDAILLTHNHYDHLDLASLRELTQRGVPIVTGLGNGRYLSARGVGQATELDWWQSCPVGDLTVTMVPAQHFSARGPFDRNRTLWGGFVIEGGGVRVCFVGDTGYAPEIFRAVRERLGPPDLALVPIGAYEPRWFMKNSHVNPEEAVQLHLDVGARVSVGMHFGTFRLTNEGIDEPPRRLREVLAGRGISEETFRLLDVGESAVFHF
jgi:L-ascorbate metabolism protein UlaG (beta-lactamase superfamily)